MGNMIWFFGFGRQPCCVWPSTFLFNRKSPLIVIVCGYLHFCGSSLYKTLPILVFPPFLIFFTSSFLLFYISFHLITSPCSCSSNSMFFLSMHVWNWPCYSVTFLLTEWSNHSYLDFCNSSCYSYYSVTFHLHKIVKSFLSWFMQ